DAVASMLYLDYSRKPGEWLPNIHGGRENLEAIDFLRAMNDAVREKYPGCLTIAEESTAWPGVTRATAEGGLGFSFKWNMGWMHDTLEYLRQDPVHRRYHQDELSFAMLYEYSERYVMPLSHDEVVHGKGSLYDKMPGDRWQKLANLRLLLAYQCARPGKPLVFMGTEFAQEREWDHDGSLDWHLAEAPDRVAFGRCMERLGQLYRETAAFWQRDHDPEGFAWIDAGDRENSVFAFVRLSNDDHRVVLLNCTPVPRHDYRIGVPAAGRYRVDFNTDATEFGGSGAGSFGVVETEPTPSHGRAQSLRLVLPPLGLLVLAPEP
ncbi:MAG: alpha amylase C-terminal domain-containing protein, partial [Gemmatimonadaceae bacterium]